MRVRKEVSPVPLEAVEQFLLCEYLDLMGYKYTAIPNSTFTKSWSQKAKNTRMGLRPGLPDMVIILPNKQILFLEMKRQRGGVVSAEQKEWIDRLNECIGVKAIVARGADEAIEIIKNLI